MFFAFVTVMSSSVERGFISLFIRRILPSRMAVFQLWIGFLKSKVTSSTTVNAMSGKIRNFVNER